MALSIHTLRALPVVEKCVFGGRLDHYVLEIMALSSDQELEKQRNAWAVEFKQRLFQEDPGNILEGTYISLDSNEDTNLENLYGPHYNTLLRLKEVYDPQHVFKYTVPRLPIDK